ncbi:polyprenyl synthetase family protein [Aeromicrobium sp. CTD01-1L150]|uniref:polyprenyl synthetase family protein n=1 Tax=Aeromicrobium sp. CTD01-1L150 TaxID=3341830 RepID=UPI0035C007B9
MTAAEDPALRDVDAALTAFLADRRRDLEPLGPELVPFLDAAQEFVAGGKRLRARFCRSGWLAAGGDATDPAIDVAAASLEWLQASALVHDDLMDGSDVRRGRPSVHRAFEGRHRDADWVGSPTGHGSAVAVLLGDLMLSWTDQQLRSSRLPTVARALDLLDLCRSEVASGQYLDVLAQTRTDVGVDEALRIVRFKSAKYTVERPLQIGAALAGADDTFIDSLSTVALPLGEAFQLRDDVLGVFGDPVVTGKPAGDDLREGKRTVLVARTLELGDDDERDLVRRLLGTPEGVTPLSELMVRTGALAAVERDITTREEAARTALEQLDPTARAAIEPLLAAVTRRAS